MEPHTSTFIETHEEGKKGLFNVFSQTNFTFEGRKPGEEIKVFTRRHWFVLLGPAISSLILSMLPIILIIFGAKWILQYELATWFTLAWIMYLLCIWFGLFYKLTMHALDVWIVTNERVIDSMQLGLFRRKVSELHLESIQDISVTTKGVIQSYFNFGDVEIQTGATAQRFKFEQIPKPIEVKDMIMSVAKNFELDRLKMIDDHDKKRDRV